MFGASVEWTDENGRNSTLEDFLMQSLEENGMLDPFSIVVDCPYAECIEFGTRPFKNNKTFRNHLEPWVRKKFAIIADYEAYQGRPMTLRQQARAIQRITYFITEKISEEGMRPHPFFRAAIYNVMSQGLENIIDENTGLDKGMYKVSQKIVEEMYRIIDECDLDFRGHLKSSIRIVEPQEISGTHAEVPEELWLSDRNHSGHGPNEIWDGVLASEWREWAKNAGGNES